MQEERIIRQGAFKAIEVVEVKDKLTPIAQQNEPPDGTEKLICVVAVNSIGEVDVITLINSEKAAWYYVEEVHEYMESDFNEPPGIYLVKFWINGSKDYWGEYDSWSEFDCIIKYKVDIKDKRKDKFIEDKYYKSFDTKIYEEPGSEFPNCLFIINDSGRGFILDILNEDVAYKSVIQEMVYHLEDIDKDHGVGPLGLYTADFSIVGDMNNLFDRDNNESIKLFNIKKVKLVLEDEPLERLSRKEKQEAELDAWGKYVDELRKQDEHIK